MDSGWTQAVIAGVAALVAVVAAVLSALQAREAGKQAEQAERQADAAHGDVDPTFHIERVSDVMLRSENCCVVARNFNRHALAVHEVRITHPLDITLIPDTASIREVVARVVMEMALQRDDLCVIKPGITLEGVGPGRDPSEYRLYIRATGAARIAGAGQHALQFSEIEDGRTIDLTYEVDFELLDGKGEARTYTGRAGLRF